MSATGVEKVFLVMVKKEGVWYWCRESVSGTGVDSVSGTGVDSVSGTGVECIRYWC